MRVLVTGANGFVGAQAVRALGAAGHAVVATARQPLQGLPPEVPGIVADLATDELAALLRSCDAVVHCAARASPWGPREDFLRDNLHATTRLLDAAEAAGTVRRFVHLSTPSIYFRFEDACDIREDLPPPARWPTAYAESKWLAERAVLARRALGPIALRPRAVFGVGDRAILPRLLGVARRGWFPLPAGGAAQVDVTCVENVVDAIALALQAPRHCEGQAFNLTNGEPMPVHALMARLFEAMDLRVRMVPLPRGVALALAGGAEGVALHLRAGREPAITRYGMGLLAYSQTLCIDAARSQLGYRPRLTIDEGFARFARAGDSR